MKLYSSIFYALGLAHLAQAGWKLDKSCKTDELKDHMDEIVSSAFSLAETGKTAVDNILGGTAQDDDKEKSDNINNILQWMLWPKKETDPKKWLASAKRTFDGIVEQKTRNDDEENSESTIIIYCDEKRLQERKNAKDKDEWWDRDVDVVYTKKNKAFAECHGLLPMVAVTYAPKRGSGKPSQIQMCPHFMDWMKEEEFKLIDDTIPQDERKRIWTRSMAKKMRDTDTFLTEIDLLSLFDKVILHEITHTLPGGVTDDVGMSTTPVIGPLLSLKNVNYGWKRCKALAEKGEGGANMPARNADSLALVASGVRFVKEGYIVNEDGSVKVR